MARLQAEVEVGYVCEEHGMCPSSGAHAARLLREEIVKAASLFSNERGLDFQAGRWSAKRRRVRRTVK